MVIVSKGSYFLVYYTQLWKLIVKLVCLTIGYPKKSHGWNTCFSYLIHVFPTWKCSSSKKWTYTCVYIYIHIYIIFIYIYIIIIYIYIYICIFIVGPISQRCFWAMAPFFSPRKSVLGSDGGVRTQPHLSVPADQGWHCGSQGCQAEFDWVYGRYNELVHGYYNGLQAN